MLQFYEKPFYDPAKAIGWTMRDMICFANQRRRAADGARDPSSIHRILRRNDRPHNYSG
jgi:hypothetical protein